MSELKFYKCNKCGKVHVIGSSPAAAGALDHIRAHIWTPVLTDRAPALDEAIAMLAGFDEGAHRLYHRIFPEDARL